MPTDYKHMVNGGGDDQREKRRKFFSAPSFIIGLMLGLAPTAIIYFDQRDTRVTTIPCSPCPEPEVTEKIVPADNDKELQAITVVEPQYDFYKILPRKEVNISEWATVEQSPPKTDESEPGTFILQIGSYREYRAANEIKAKLAMIGIVADIQRVVINGRDVRHRVRAGPYNNPAELQLARERLLANDLDFVLLQLKMEDL